MRLWRFCPFLEKMKEENDNYGKKNENTHPNPIISHVFAVYKCANWNVILELYCWYLCLVHIQIPSTLGKIFHRCWYDRQVSHFTNTVRSLQNWRWWWKKLNLLLIGVEWREWCLRRLLLLCQLQMFTEQPLIRLSNVQTTMDKHLAHRGGSQKSIFGKVPVIILYYYCDGKFGDNLQRINFRLNTAFVVTKKAILGYQGH